MSNHLPVVETFHSIQGEGNHAGRGAFFIRLANCSVGCPWCDTKNSWDVTKHPKKTISQLANETLHASQKGASFVVITGGEPLHHDLSQLCNAIRNSTQSTNRKIIPIHLETSGVNEITGNPNWITLSPKPHAPPNLNVLISCHEIKVVIHSEKDIIFAENIADKIKQLKHESTKNPTSNNTFLYLQPGWDSQSGLRLALDYIKCNPKWRLSLQTHKWLNIK
ncbi:7-carboxy-7-deazaguanine synthase QueE [Prochlorococcus sp. MIT 1341]|uniref:7-carboxy-7-deazaguanine synthase QueE n=1 Tax=Prochlorococcus sp. MIT 1341 TaxID=3096221 RepID=UPI002A7628E7|nr:7-carboxy-7-deazaguanine synthase QueE [Prochlorococcus sp. MIT 1341]